MTRRNCPAWTQNVFGTVKLGIAILAISAAINIGAPGALATPINYTMSGAFGNFPPVAAITGSFTFDAATDTESNVSITIAGHTFTQTAALVIGANNQIVTTDGLTLIFQTPLDLAADLLGSAVDAVLNAISTPDVTGSAVIAASAVPEPGTLTLLGGALGVLLLGRRANRLRHRSRGAGTIHERSC